MKTSETIEKIAPALIKAQNEIGAATKGASNPFFRSKYADLGSVMEACKMPLLENGLCVIQPVGHDEHGEYLETVIIHASGQFISERMRIEPPKKMICPNEKKDEKFEPFLAPDPQAQGSAITYARRYALQSMLFIPAEDDDGEGAMNRNQSSRPESNQKHNTQSTQPQTNDFP
jgi:hypothetical protein